MTLDDFKQKYPDFYGFKHDPHLECITCLTSKPLWFKMSELRPACGSIIKAVFVNGFIRYMLVEKNLKLTNLGAFMATGSTSGIVAWMPAGASVSNFIKVNLQPPNQEVAMCTETALHIPLNQEAVFQYRFSTESLRDTSISNERVL